MWKRIPFEQAHKILPSCLVQSLGENMTIIGVFVPLFLLVLSGLLVAFVLTGLREQGNSPDAHASAKTTP